MPRTKRELAEKIAEMEELLESGVTSITTDGTSTAIDLDRVERELARLRDEYAGRKRRRFRRINGTGF